MTWRAAAPLAAAALLVTSPAHAEADATRAQSLFEEGKALRGAGKIAAACVDFEESRRLEEGIGVTLYLADCYEHAGDLRRARSEYLRAESLAVARGDKRAAVARHRAEVLDRAPQTAAPASTAQRWAGLATAAVGVAGVGIGVTFGVVALSKLSQSSSGAEELPLRDQARGAMTASTVGFLAGSTALAAGLALYLTAPKDGDLTLAPALGAGSAGATLAWRF